MLEQGYDINITNDSVAVKRDNTTTPMDEKVLGGVLCIGVSVFLFPLMMFAPGRYGDPSLWQNLSDYSWPSDGFSVPLVIAALMSALFVVIFLAGIRQFFPSGEEFHCDRFTFTMSKIPWFSLRGKWKSKSFPTKSVVKLRYAVTFRGKGTYLYGFRFSAMGQEQKIFSGLPAPEAAKVLAALKALGLYVVDDAEVDERIADTLRARA